MLGDIAPIIGCRLPGEEQPLNTIILSQLHQEQTSQLGLISR